MESMPISKNISEDNIVSKRFSISSVRKVLTTVINSVRYFSIIISWGISDAEASLVLIATTCFI